MSRHTPSRRAGAVGVALVLVLVMVQLLVVVSILGQPPERELAVMRLDSLRAFYAAEAGMNMAVRERMLNTDHDADGGIGTISADGNTSNDPAVGTARVSVTSAPSGSDTILTSRGRCGDAVREIEATID